MTFTKEQLDRMVQDASTLVNRFRGCQIHGDVCTHVLALAAEVERLQQSCNSWSDAFYREERRATEYHNTDAKCGHPAACIRNVEGCGAVCLMCRQQYEIDRLRTEVERLKEHIATISTPASFAQVFSEFCRQQASDTNGMRGE